MRVLHVISRMDAAAGGTTTALVGMAAAQSGAGLNVTVVSTYRTPGPPHDDALRAAGVTVEHIGPARTALWRHPLIVPTLRRLIAAADVVHIHALWEEIQHQSARIALAQRVPYFISPHGMLDPWSLAQSHLKKRLYMALRLRRNLDRASAIHFTTSTERDLVAPLRLKPPTIVEPIGLDLSEFENLPPRGTFRRKQRIADERPIVLFLSRLHYKKGLDLLIPAFARGAPADALLVLAGPVDEGYQPELERLIDSSAARDRVLLTGMLSGAARIQAFVDAEVFALSSYQENFGIAVAEAMAAGCPVIVSDQVNIAPEIRSAGAGAVVPTQIDPLAAELKRWLGDRELRRAAGERGRAFVRQHYDWKIIAAHFAEHYQRAIDRTSSRASPALAMSQSSD